MNKKLSSLLSIDESRSESLVILPFRKTSSQFYYICQDVCRAAHGLELGRYEAWLIIQGSS